MEKTLVVYQSQTGFTAQYAQWIAEALHCSAKPLAEVSTQELNEPELLIYGGWVMANQIKGLKKVQKERTGRLVVFAVGVTPYSDKQMQTLREGNPLPAGALLFYMPGGLRMEKLNLVQRTVLKALGKSLAKKENKTPEDEEMLQVMSGGKDPANKRYIQPLVDALG